MTDQLQQNLENLLTRVQDGWDGREHCLLMCMADDLPIRADQGLILLRQRLQMVNALGFGDDGRGAPMYSWNDTPGRTKDEVLDRVKDALNNAGLTL